MNQTKNALQPRQRASSPFTFATASSPHLDHPERNEDSLKVDWQNGLAVVCDGVGSAIGADQASRLACRTVKACWRQICVQCSDTVARSSTPSETIRELLEEANEKVLALGKRLIKKQVKHGEQSEKKEYTETTVVLALFYQYQTGYKMAYGHVGDSRIYLLRQKETLRRLTIDDGYFLLAQNKGTLDEQTVWRIEQANSREQLPEQEREHFEKRNGITQSLGDETINIHTGELELCPGDRILLCTDGIHDNLTDSEIEEALRKGARTTVAKTLLHRAATRALQGETASMRAKKDDMSAIVITCSFSLASSL